MLQRKSFGILLAAAVLLGASPCCARPPREPLRLGVNVWPPDELLYLARERGFLEAEGVDVDLVDFSSYTGELRAYHQGRLDGMLATLNEVQIKDNFLDQPVVVMVVDYSYGCDALVARAGLSGVGALKGKRIAYEESALGSYVLERALQSAGLTIRDVEAINRLPEEGAQDFLSGAVDAVVTYEPLLGRLLSQGRGQVFFSSRDLPGEIVDVLAMRRSVLDERQDDVRRLLRAWFRALDDLRANPLEAAAIMARREGGDVESFLRSLQGTRIPDRAENLRLVGTSMTPGALHATTLRLSEFLQRHGLTRSVATPAEILHPGLLESL
jgi:NitT/TauT family transport system substrate-binding protein